MAVAVEGEVPHKDRHRVVLGGTDEQVVHVPLVWRQQHNSDFESVPPTLISLHQSEP